MPADTPEVWYLMPSANSANAARCVPCWRDMGYRVAILQDREPIDAPCDAKVVRGSYPGWAASINSLYREVVPDDCPVVVGGGDDLYPDPGLRAAEIAGQFLERFPDTFGVMQPIGDRFEATESICGSPWLGREWMRRMYQGRGGLCEQYAQQYADEELYWVARCSGVLETRENLTQRHEHFRRRGEAAPAYWVDSAAANEARDCQTFIERADAGFPGAAPDMPGLIDLSVFRDGYDGRAHRRYREVLKPGGSHDEAPRRMREAFERLAREGAQTVGVFGAGQHTLRCELAFAGATLEIAAIIDDDPARVGSTVLGRPVISVEQAVDRDPPFDAVVLSSDSMENRLRERARVLAGRGVRVVALYSGSSASGAGTRSGAA